MGLVAFYNFSSIFKIEAHGSLSNIDPIHTELQSTCDKVAAALHLGELLAF